MPIPLTRENDSVLAFTDAEGSPSALGVVGGLLEISTDDGGGVFLTPEHAQALVGELIVFACVGRLAADTAEGRAIVRVFAEELIQTTHD